MTSPKNRPERTSTDESLQRERAKTDREMAKGRPAIEADANRVLDRARGRAAETLEAARDLADTALEDAHALPEAVAAIAKERARADAALETERVSAAATLEGERIERERALAELLRRERFETDDRLGLERDRADHVVAARDNFLAMVSHDLRNLLGGVALSAAAVLRHADDARARDEAARIQRFTARMDRLVGDLIDIVSMEAGKLHVTSDTTDVGKLVTDIAETFRPSAATRSIELTVRVPAEETSAVVDPQRIQQVLANLIGNALKFTGQNGSVEVELARDGDQLHVTVLDTGPGIDPESANRIFERFWQSSHNDRRGLGLGLYISRSIVEAHGGRIWYAARPTGGSAFHFTVPIRA